MIRIASVTHPSSKSSRARAKAGLEELLSRKEIGFWQIPSRTEANSEALKCANELRAISDRMLLFGIGGSSLGSQFLADLYSGPSRRIDFCDNVDPYYLLKTLGKPEDWDRGCFVFVSKTGSTIETLAGLQFLSEWMPSSDWKTRSLVMTEESPSPLRDWALKNKVKIVSLASDIGGRYSVLSQVGMLPASYMGKSIDEFQVGANWALKNTELVHELVAQSLDSFSREEWITHFWNYGTVLRYYGHWLVQLWGESLGKSNRADGIRAPRTSTPVAAVGATDQHSALQQVMGGARDKFLVFHRIKEFAGDFSFSKTAEFQHLDVLRGKSLGLLLNIQGRATFESIKAQGLSGLEIELSDLSPESIGALLMTWKLVVASMGLGLGINPFDQSGVDLGKRLALDILKQ